MPPPLAFEVPPAVIVAALPPTVTVRACEAVNPETVIVTPVVPTAPVVGVRPVAVGVIVKLVAEVALLVPSETTTVWAPAGRVGIVKVTVAEPLAEVVPPAVIVAAVPPTVTVNACEATKPVAVIVTPVVLSAPLDGVKPVAAALTVKFVPEVALLVPSETTTAFEPFVVAGTVKVTVEEPVAAVVPPAVIVAAVPPTVTVNACEAMKPFALIVTDEPTAPLVGLRPLADCVTVKLVPEVTAELPSETTTLSAPCGAAGIVKVIVALPELLVVPRR